MRHMHRVDANQAAIVEALQRAGCTTLSLTSIGNGCPDLLVARANQYFLLELKADSELAKSQIDWINAWNAKVHVVRSVGEALAAVGLGKSPKLSPTGGTISARDRRDGPTQP
jgi:hypothetical protein